MNYLVTGGAGFIGFNFLLHMIENNREHTYIVLDKLTYAGNPENIEKIKNDIIFIHGDIACEETVCQIFKDHKIDIVVNFAAETHVDRSIGKPDDFIKTDIFGTYVLLEASRKYGVCKFIQISTDEVYGSIEHGKFKETDALMPSSPYSASKTGADRIAYSYYVTYDLPVIITRCSNNYGPYQYPEKVIPLFITNAIEDKLLPLYGDGKNIRDWIYVLDHCLAVDFLIKNGINGEVYNIGGDNEKENIYITQCILSGLKKPETLMKFVKDRLGHDRRYALDCKKIHKMGWKPKYNFKQGMKLTLDWYQENQDWWRKIKSGEYLKYYEQMYS